MLKQEDYTEERMNNSIVLLVGESSSGKDSLATMLEHDGFKILKSYTTRPRRQNEGDTHIFIKPEEVEQYKNEFVAYTKIGKFEYFSTMKQLLESDIYIIDPKGVKYLKSKINNIKIITIYINVPEEERLDRALHIRKDNKEEVDKRFKAEKDQFDEFKLNAAFDYSICNHDLVKAYKTLKYIIEVEGEI
jgi:guanylate kinase